MVDNGPPYFSSRKMSQFLRTESYQGKNPGVQKLERRTRPPECMAVLTGTGEYAYQADEGLFVIPLRTLGA